MTETIALSGVTKRYGPIIAVRDLDLTLDAGEVVALVGHNGAGKTTQIKMMLGLARPTAGAVRLLGADPTGDPGVRAAVGYLPESVSFHLALTGRETLAFYARLKGVPLAALGRAFAAVGLDGAEDRAVGAYSKGMRQRLGLAQALLGHPRVLILDEPTSGLDPALRRDFYAIVAARAAEGATVLLASHALTELEGRADRVVIVNQGAKIADGSLDALRALARLPVHVRVRPAGPFAAAGWRRLADGSFETTVVPEAKLPILARLLGSAPTGTVGASRLDVVTVSLASLTIFLVPLIALLLSHDAIAGEAERGTLLLLLAYPVSRSAVILGKFAGQLAILATSTILGYGVAAVAVGWNLAAAAWAAFAAMIGASILLGAVFLALGLLASTLVRQRSTAGGIAIGLWLGFVLIYDMAFLGLLVASGGHALPPRLVDALLALNPADAYRLLTLGAAGAGDLTGIGALSAHTALTPPILVAVLLAWTAAPLALAARAFSRREV